MAQLDQVMSNFARHKRLEEQQMRFGGQEVLQQRLHPPIQPAAVVANNKVCIRTYIQTSCSVHAHAVF